MKPFSFFIFLLLLVSECAVAEVIKDSLQNRQHVIAQIHIAGNRTTKPWIVERELSFQIGDTLSSFELVNALAISKTNLTNTSLFNFVELKFIAALDEQTEIYILLTERWYLWPIPVFELAETNFNSWFENKDFSRINYGIDFTKYNFRGRNETLKILLQFGFTELVAISYTIPYFNKSKTLGLEVYGGYGQNHEVNYSSFNNKRLFYKDVSQVQKNHVLSGIEFKYRRKFFSKHYLGASFNQVDVTDTIVQLNQDYLLNGSKEAKYLGLNYKYIFDTRNNKNYPLEGAYFRFDLAKMGLGLFSNDIDLWWGNFDFKKFYKLSPKFYLAGMMRMRYYFNDLQPYYLRDGLGYSDKSTIRSYELYVIDAQQMALARLQLRYQLFKPRSSNFDFIPVNKFKKIHYSIYLGLFGDAGYANDQYGYPSNDLSNDLQYGSGIALDFATYYDLVMRVEYSINKFAEHGLFLHFVAPI